MDSILSRCLQIVKNYAFSWGTNCAQSLSDITWKKLIRTNNKNAYKLTIFPLALVAAALDDLPAGAKANCDCFAAGAFFAGAFFAAALV